MIRFLSDTEYRDTIPLLTACFGEDPEFLRDYYGDASVPGDVQHCRIAVKEVGGKIVSMVHLKPVTAVYDHAPENTRTLPVTYLMCVATDPAYRHRGYMDEVMHFVTDTLMSEGALWCFLIAVDRQIYRHLHFIHDWDLTPEALELLYADDGLTKASARLLNASHMEFPDRILSGFVS